MSPYTSTLVVVYVGAFVSAAVGLFQPRTRASFQIVEPVVALTGSVLALLLGRDWLLALSAGTLFPSVYYTFDHWRRTPRAPKKAFLAAFLGTMFFVTMTTQSLRTSLFGAALGILGPYAAVWLTERTHRAVGLGLLILATVLSVTRVPLLLAHEPLTLHFTTAHD